MALQITTLKRSFFIQGKDVNLTDPGPDMLPEDVRKHYAGTYPELTNATITGPKVEGGKAKYTFKTTVGTKG
jgi:PRTRC genetic system protein C